MSALCLTSKIGDFKGVGPQREQSLLRLGIETAEDLIYFFPRTYEDRRNMKTIDRLENGEKALIKAKISLVIKGSYRKGKKQTLRLLAEDSTGGVEIVFFNAGYLEKSIKRDVDYVFFGSVSEKNGKKQMVHPDITIYTENIKEGILPIYPLTKGITEKNMRKLQEAAIPLIDEAEEYLPEKTILRNKLCSISYGLKNIHFPENGQKLKEAKFRLIFEEFLMLQTGLLSLRARNEENKNGIPFKKDVNIHKFLNTFPYELTGGQKRVLLEIFADMESQNSMHRLVQGDVGSGKTALAAAAMYKAVYSGFQAAIMAPTEILARQHFESLKMQFEPFDVKVGFLSGSLTSKEKRSVLGAIKSGEVDVLIGTHAIIQPQVLFKKLGLVITDEQHRFGVEQRSLLTKKGDNPDILVMTATPIPRTLAVVLYGDLDISYINEMPPGRKRIITKAVSEEKRNEVYDFLGKEVEKGRQAYVVAPLIEDSEVIDARSTATLAMELKKRFRQFKVGLIHGGLPQAEKDKIMKSFHKGEIQILVSTVVIEVGINVPNASVMVIENAERFGLAQLHQLRGRVGRGQEQSYCILVTNENMEIAKERADTMVSTSDGFVIAEKDLELRGPGEFFGIRQHGLPELKLADISKHRGILEKTRNEAQILLAEDPLLAKEENIRLKGRVEKLFSIDNTNL